MNNILIGAEGIDGANFLGACLSMNNQVYFNDCSLNEKVEFFFNAMSIHNKNKVIIFYFCWHNQSLRELSFVVI